MFSMERFIAVMFPLKRTLICNKKRNQISILALFIFSLAFYSIYLITTGIEPFENGSVFHCVTYNKWFNFVKKFAFLDTILTILLPFFIILFINISISLKLKGCSILPQKWPLCHKQNTPTNTSPTITFTKYNNRNCSNNLLNANNVRIGKNYILTDPDEDDSVASLRSMSRKMRLLSVGTNRRRRQTYSRTTSILILISVTFILLNSLMAYSKLRYHFAEHDDDENEKMFNNGTTTTMISDEDVVDVGIRENVRSLNDELIERISCYLYYLNFSINFFLYVLKKSKFRDILFGIFKTN